MVRIVVRGVVQGVGFRPTVFRLAKELGLSGHVKNTGSEVEILVNGDAEEFVRALNQRLPSIARIDEYELFDGEPGEGAFVILESGTGSRHSPVPPDTALCDQCLRELGDGANRRCGFPFTNCTVCGARFSVIHDVPYDRANTSMRDFKLCEECQKEYKGQGDRRFHAQTISCPACGPRLNLHGVETETPIKDFAALLDAGKLGALKGWGGTHVLCIPSGIGELRRRFGRPQKPLAVMVASLNAAKKYATVSPYEEALLTSPQRPIVLLDRATEALAATAPGLDRIGLYLPYSALHHILFEHLDNDALVMTSGNLPGEPMAIKSSEILKLDADAFLLHDREIVNRIDDSVLIPFRDSAYFARKSRGFVPEPLPLPHSSTLVAMGADMNSTGAVSFGGRAFMTQHIGDVAHYETSRFLRGAVAHMMKLYGIERPEAVVVDMHPRYSSRRVGKGLARGLGVPLLEVQHHVAHGFALAAEHGLENLRLLSCDGTGYGEDGAIWGGEALEVSKGRYRRLGHLEYIPLLGGDRAVEDPRRVVFALCSLLDLDLPYFKGKEANVLETMILAAVPTSSTGRVLDALACWLGICERMTYDGEPAMKLEPYLRRGEPSHDFVVKTEAGVVRTLDLFSQLSDHLKPGEETEAKAKADLARSLVDALLDGLIKVSDPKGILGFTGGVSYNLVMNQILEKKLEERGVKLITHARVPNGDGGISYGQLVGGGYLVSGNTG